MQENKNPKEVVFFDMDGTLFSGQSQMFFLNFLRQRGFIGTFPYLKVVLWFLFYKVGIAKNPRIILEYFLSAAHMSNVSLAKADELGYQCFTESIKKRVFDEARRVIEDHIRFGREVVLLSNAVSPLVRACALSLGLKSYIATKLETREGKIVAKIDGAIVYGREKVREAESFLSSRGILTGNAWAYADHHSDIPLLSFVGHPFAVNPDNQLLIKARQANWPVLSFRS